MDTFASLPVGKRIDARGAAALDELGDAIPAIVETLQQALERVLLAIDPSRRNALPRAVDDLFGEVAQLVEPGLEIVERTDVS